MSEVDTPDEDVDPAAGETWPSLPTIEVPERFEPPPIQPGILPGLVEDWTPVEIPDGLDEAGIGLEGDPDDDRPRGGRGR